MMETVATLEASCSPSALFHHVAVLDRYPVWMPLVHAARPLGRDAWDVELRSRIGPLARSKRLRMVRTVHQVDREVVFEREELDGRRHAPWVLRAVVEPTAAGSRLEMHLSYGGSLWTPGVLQHVLDAEIERGRDQLRTLVSDVAS